MNIVHIKVVFVSHLSCGFLYSVSGEGQIQVILQVREGVAPTISGEY